MKVVNDPFALQRQCGSEAFNVKMQGKLSRFWNRSPTPFFFLGSSLGFFVREIYIYVSSLARKNQMLFKGK
ncbi:hypothetical protein V6N11_007898 [Hibiscus sabdariffa]|uniref:Uncharacterized protein n=1 Tax=Hibiscus sabdariffa TaxID=183260 RepID=A0ABR2PZ31_9ROSI